MPLPGTPFPGFAAIASEPKAALIIIHGLAEYAGRYHALADAFSARGVSCFAYDQIGHGDRSGARTHVRRFDDYVADLGVVAGAVRKHSPGLRLFLWGHSMGAIVATLGAAREAGYAGVIASSNSLDVFRRGPNPLNPVFRLASVAAPRIRIPLGLDPQKISADESVQRAYANDPKIPSTASLRLIVEFARACERCRACAPRLTTPWLVIHGEADAIAPAHGAQALFDLLGSTDKRLVIYPALRHEVHNEPSGRDAMVDLMTDWMLRRAA